MDWRDLEQRRVAQAELGLIVVRRPMWTCTHNMHESLDMWKFHLSPNARKPTEAQKFTVARGHPWKRPA